MVDYMGSDLSVTNAARVSFAKRKAEFDTKDERLIKFLAKHNHWTPFAHTAITLRMRAPVPIRTQCFKHKQGLVENEESRRYISCKPALYIPPNFRSKPEGSIKQGSAGVHPNTEDWRHSYATYCSEGIQLYMEMLEDGVAPEQARLVLPQGVHVNWIWTGNIFAFANFVKKRRGPDAQAEIQELARMVDKAIEPLFPVSWKALVEEEE